MEANDKQCLKINILPHFLEMRIMCFPGFVCNSMAKDIFFVGANLCFFKIPLNNNNFHILRHYIFLKSPIPFSPTLYSLFCIQLLPSTHNSLKWPPIEAYTHSNYFLT
jgi:hypothetical protein